MQTQPPSRSDSLFDRADRAIAEAIATRARVRAGLDRAKQNARLLEAIKRQGDRWQAALVSFPTAQPQRLVFMPSEISILPEYREDAELEAVWRRVLPTIETPIAIFRS